MKNAKIKVKVVYTLDPTGMSLDISTELVIILKNDEILNTLYCCHDKQNRFYHLIKDALIDKLKLNEMDIYSLHIWKIYAL